MILKQTIQFQLLIFALIIIIIGCKKDKNEESPMPPTLPSYLIEDSLFDCNSSTLVTTEIDFQINVIYEFANHIFYGGFEKFMAINLSNNEVVLNEDYNASKFIEYNGNLIFCSQQGIFAIDSELNVEQKANLNCRDVLVNSNNELLFVGGNDNIVSSQVYKLTSDNEIIAHTNKQSGTLCTSITRITEASNGDIWGTTCDNDIIRFKNNQYFDFFNGSNSPLPDYSLEQFILPYMNDMIAVFKGGVYQIMKYKNEEWITLFEIPIYGDTLSDQETEISLPSLNSAKIYDHKLYIGTTIAGCHGFHVFDISKDELLDPNDYYIVQDSNFNNQCISAFNIIPNGNIYIANGNEQVTVFNCN